MKQSLLIAAFLSISIPCLSEPVTRELKRGLLLQRLSSQAIEGHKQAIKYRIKRAQMIKVGVVATGLTIAGVCTLLAKQQRAKDKKAITEEEIYAQTDQIKLLQIQAVGSVKGAQNTKDLPDAEGIVWIKGFFFDWKTIQNNLQAAIFYLGLGYYGPAILERLGFYEEAQAYKGSSNYDAVSSFGKKVLYIPKLKKTLEYFAERLAKPDLLPYQREYYEKGLISVSNHLNDKLEILLGYMLYKIESQPANNLHNSQALGVIAFIKELTSDFYASLEDILNNNECYNTRGECGELYRLITAFCVSLEQEIAHFALLEQ